MPYDHPKFTTVKHPPSRLWYAAELDADGGITRAAGPVDPNEIDTMAKGGWLEGWVEDYLDDQEPSEAKETARWVEEDITEFAE